MATATPAKPETLDDRANQSTDGMEFDTSAVDVDQVDGADDQKSDANEPAGDDSAANEESQQEEPLRKMTLAEQKQSLIEEIIGQREKVRVAEAEVAADQQALKDSRAVLGKRQATLGQLIDRLEDVNKGQLQLPFQASQPAGDATDQSSETAGDNVRVEDIHGQAPVSVLKLPKGMLEKLEEAEVETVQDLERRIAAGDFVPGAIKGIGQSAVDKISDALMAYRAECPVSANG